MKVKQFLLKLVTRSLLMADPGLPRRGTPTPKRVGWAPMYYLTKFYTKTAWKNKLAESGLQLPRTLPTRSANECSHTTLGDFWCTRKLNTGQWNPLFHTFAEFRPIVNRVVAWQSTDWLADNAQFSPHKCYFNCDSRMQGFWDTQKREGVKLLFDQFVSNNCMNMKLVQKGNSSLRPLSQPL